MSATPRHAAVERTDTRSRDLDEVHELISRRYVDHLPRVLDGPDAFTFRSQAASCGELTVDHITWRARMAITADPFATMLIVSVLNGRFDVTAGRQHAQAGRGQSLLYPLHTGLDVIMDRMTYQVAQFPVAAAARVAEQLGVAPADFRFHAMTPVTPAANRRWLATIAYLTRILDTAPAETIPALVVRNAIESAATAAVTAFPNTTMTLDYTPGAGPVTPAAIRRAAAYLDSHAADPIRLGQVAAAAGLGVRALQAGFRRHLDTTPVAYLRQVRLEHAHRDLQAADPTNGATVAQIAARWGFTDPSRFAAWYRSAYGTLPSRTLHT